MALRKVTIVLNEKCCPEVNPAKIGKTPAQIIWTRKDGTEIRGVGIDNPASFFDPGRPDGNDWTAKYNGSTGTKSWFYIPYCVDGPCSTVASSGLETEPPQMNNEGG